MKKRKKRLRDKTWKKRCKNSKPRRGNEREEMEREINERKEKKREKKKHGYPSRVRAGRGSDKEG